MPPDHPPRWRCLAARLDDQAAGMSAGLHPFQMRDGSRRSSCTTSRGGGLVSKRAGPGRSYKWSWGGAGSSLSGRTRRDRAYIIPATPGARPAPCGLRLGAPNVWTGIAEHGAPVSHIVRSRHAAPGQIANDARLVRDGELKHVDGGAGRCAVPDYHPKVRAPRHLPVFGGWIQYPLAPSRDGTW